MNNFVPVLKLNCIMIRLVNLLLSSARRFTAGDFAVLKLLMCCVGIIVGMYFAEFFLGCKAFVWGAAAVLWAVMLVRIVVLARKEKKEGGHEQEV